MVCMFGSVVDSDVTFRSCGGPSDEMLFSVQLLCQPGTKRVEPGMFYSLLFFWYVSFTTVESRNLRKQNKKHPHSL